MVVCVKYENIFSPGGIFIVERCFIYILIFFIAKSRLPAYNKEKQGANIEKWLSFYEALQSAVFSSLPTESVASTVQLDPTETMSRMRLLLRSSLRRG